MLRKWKFCMLLGSAVLLFMIAKVSWLGEEDVGIRQVSPNSPASLKNKDVGVSNSVDNANDNGQTKSLFRNDDMRIRKRSSNYDEPARNPAVNERKSMDNLNDKGRSEVIFVLSQEAGACAEWSSSYPDSLIIVVGSNYTPGTRSGKQCLHIENMAGASDVLDQNTKVDGPVLVSDDSPTAKSCVQRVLEHATIASSSRYRIVYSGGNPVYNTRHHFGCGGTDGALNGKQPYSVCRRSDTLGPVVGTHSEGPYCDNVYPSMSLTQGIHAIPTMQCAWIPKTSLWMLPFLDGEPGGSAVAKRMLVEKLLWQTGHRVQVAPHVLSREYILNQSTLTSMQTIAKALSEASCKTEGPEECCLRLAKNLLQKGYLSTIDFELLQKWSAMIGSTNQSSLRFRNFPKQACLDRPLISHLSSSEESSSPFLPNLGNRKYLQKKICGNSTNSNYTHPWLQYRDILLIVTANSNRHYNTFPYYDSFYRQFFPHIIYCGPGKAFPLKGIELNSFNFMGYRPQSHKLPSGSVHYECLIQASGLGYNVRGYLMSADDIFLNMHRFRHNDLNKAWYYQFNNLDRANPFNKTLCRGETCGPDHGNNDFWHRFDNVTSKTITDLKNSDSPAAKRCNANREEYFGGVDWYVRILSDTSFTPKRYIEDVVFILEVFLKYEDYLEIALPTSIACIITPDEVDPIYMDMHNLENPSKEPYSHMNLKPTHPDLVVLSILDRPEIFRYPIMLEPWMYLSPQHLQGMSIFHRYKFSFIAKGSPKHVKLHCQLINFFDDPNGDADKHITRIEWPPYQPKKGVKKITKVWS